MARATPTAKPGPAIDVRARPASIAAVLGVTGLASVSNGTFWSGLVFVTAAEDRFSPALNLALGALMGAVYALAARGSGVLSRARAGRISSRAALAGALMLWAVAALAPVALPGVEAILWACAIIGAGTSALVWPIVEVYLAGGRRGVALRAAIGQFNIIWTPASALSLLAMPVLARFGPLWPIGSCAVFNAAALLAVSRLPVRPGDHGPDDAGTPGSAVGHEYPWLARAVSWLLPLSYVISSTLAPVLPHRLAAVGVHAVPGSVVAALWMTTRFGVLFLMWRTGFWHGRWGALVAAGVALAGGLALVLLATEPVALGAGLVVFGCGMGLTYYAALYYSLAVGSAAIDAGGSFETLIGVGFCVGPLMGLVGNAVTSPAHADSATVLLGWVAAACAFAGALRSYLGARRARSRRARSRT